MKIPFNGMGRKLMTKKVLATQRSRMYRLFKESLKCCSCGYDRDSSALEFHHIIPVDKLEEIPKLVSIGDYDIVISEFKKCAVICSNCHNIIHNSTNARVAIEVATSLTPVDVKYFQDLCETFNVLVDNNDEEIDNNLTINNVDVLVSQEIIESKDANRKLKFERQQALLDYLRTIDGQSASIINKKKLAKEFNVSDMSIRRDLMELQNNGSININGIVEVLI